MPKPQRPLEKVVIINTKTKKTAKVNKADFDPKNSGDWKLAKPGKAKAAAPEPSPEPEAEEAETEPAAEGEETEAQDWKDMAWPAARAYIKKITGVFPKSKAEAADLMED